MIRHSPRSASSNKRHIVGPTKHIPWSVDVVSAVPEEINKRRPLTSAIAGEVHGRWACAAYPEGIFCVWQIKNTILNEPLEASDEFLELYLPEFSDTGNPINDSAADIVRPLLALATAQGDNEAVNLYMLHPTTGVVALRKVSRRDLQSKIPLPRSRLTASVRIRDFTRISDEEDLPEEEENFVSLTCEKSLVIAGTSRGNLYLITFTALPAQLHVQKVKTTSSGLFSRFIGGFVSSKHHSGDEAPATHVLPLSQTDFLSLSTQAGVVQWKVEQKIASGHHATFHSNELLRNLSQALGSEDWTVEEILHAAISADHESFHAILRGQTSEREIRLYWTVFQFATADSSEAPNVSLISSHWLSRFAMPDQVNVSGLVTCENDNAYASFSVNETEIIMVLLGDGQDIVQEVDIPPQMGLMVPGMMERDMVTHGYYMVVSSGLGLRARYISQDARHPSPKKRPRLDDVGRRTSTVATVQTLVSHLRSYFWESFQDPNVDRPMPPSLCQNNTDREQAIVNVAVELQHKGDAASYTITIEWHRSFIKLIQDSGLYRCLSSEGKWSLFGIGQELHVFGEIANLLMHQYKHEGLDWLSKLKSYDLANWYLEIQRAEEESNWQNAKVWHEILGASLDSALQFREDFGEDFYDVLSERPSEPLWISDPAMQEMLRLQLRYWKVSPEGVPLSVIEPVVKTTFLSYFEVPVSQESKEEMAKIQKSAISLLRVINDGNDELAFELCIQYEYFEGLCEIAHAHERKADSKSYSLDPLFETILGTDLMNGMTFPQFVLQWHTERGLYGHVINYGRHSQADLKLVMDENDQLRQYRWIPAIRQGFYGQTTEFCLENCSEKKGLKAIQWALSMAKLSNKLVAGQNAQIQERQRQIEKTLDMVNAQEMLVDSNSDQKDRILMAPDELVELSLKKLQDHENMDDRVRFAMIGLAVCASMKDENAAMENTSRIWAECILLNYAVWNDWALEGGGDDLALLREEALSNTVFGVLLDECRKDKSLSRVTYGRHIETAVIDRAQGDENREAFIRVLRVVADPSESVTGESLMVSTF